MFRRTSARALVVAAFAAPALLPVAAAATPSHDHFNDKFEFDNVTVTDGDGSTSSVTIYAGSKQNGSGNQSTTCEYDTADDQFLGQFESLGFADPDADDVRSFCVDHFADRR